jgi:hypothetical protein
VLGGKHIAQGTDVAARGRWPLMLRTGWVVVRLTTWASPSLNSTAKGGVGDQQFRHAITNMRPSHG